MGLCESSTKHDTNDEQPHSPLESMLFPDKILTYVKSHIDEEKGSLTTSFDFEQTYNDHTNISVMFIDIVKFTSLVINKDPKTIAKFLHSLFLHIETIKDDFPTIKKIETIGDCIVFTEGLFFDTSAPYKMIEFAEAILLKLSKLSYESNNIYVRIGIDIGNIGTCIIGAYVPRLCIFGDTVVYASRLQSIGEPNKITCSVRFQNAIELQKVRLVEKRENTCMKGLAPSTTFTYCIEIDTIDTTIIEKCSNILYKLQCF
jgi:class 3 adenylate cyclase